jgi:hypothetical protein
MACLVPTIAAGMVSGLFYPALSRETVPQITSETVYDACVATGVTFLYLPPLTITVSEQSNMTDISQPQLTPRDTGILKVFARSYASAEREASPNWGRSPCKGSRRRDCRTGSQFGIVLGLVSDAPTEWHFSSRLFHLS